MKSNANLKRFSIAFILIMTIVLGCLTSLEKKDHLAFATQRDLSSLTGDDNQEEQVENNEVEEIESTAASEKADDAFSNRELPSAEDVEEEDGVNNADDDDEEEDKVNDGNKNKNKNDKKDKDND